MMRDSSAASIKPILAFADVSEFGDPAHGRGVDDHQSLRGAKGAFGYAPPPPLTRARGPRGFDNTSLAAETMAMPVLDLIDLGDAVPRGSSLIGLDVGSNTIGVAASDASLMIASPIGLIRRTKFTKDAASLFALMATRDAPGAVVGLPINMNGTEGPKCQSVRAFVRHLLRLRDMPVAFWDERLSSVAVNRLLIEEADASRARRREAVDKMAAAWILQGALDRLGVARA